MLRLSGAWHVTLSDPIRHVNAPSGLAGYFAPPPDITYLENHTTERRQFFYAHCL